MKINTVFQISIWLLVTACLKNGQAIGQQPGVRLYSLLLFDSARNRSIPVALYLPVATRKAVHPKLVIFSHGYAQNKPGANKDYSYLTENLAAHGFYVASIQHELATDSLLPLTGIPQVVRKTNWQRGVVNIVFVISEMKKRYPLLDYQHLALIGHSNGGDMCMLFALLYPVMANKIISLDNRRVAFPRTNQPTLYSLRSSDQLADEAVLPTADEQKKYGITIIQLRHTMHNSMDNSGSSKQRKEISRYVRRFLKAQ